MKFITLKIQMPKEQKSSYQYWKWQKELFYYQELQQRQTQKNFLTYVQSFDQMFLQISEIMALDTVIRNLVSGGMDENITERPVVENFIGF